MKKHQDFELGQSDEVHLFKQIFNHEREFRGVNWLEDFLDAHGKPREGFVENVLQHTFQKLADSKGAFEFPQPQLYTPDNAKLLDVIGFKKEALASISSLKGQALKVYLLELLHNLQQVEKELNSEVINWKLASQLLSGVGVIWTGGKFLLPIVGMMSQGISFTVALETAIGASITLATAGLAALVVATIAFVLLMLKEAREFHLILNNTDYQLSLYEVYRHHGKVDILPTIERATGKVAINARGKGETGNLVYGGIFGLKKKDGAFYGAEGVIQLDMYDAQHKKHQTSTFLAYSVPLTGVFGGDNGCFIKCSVGNPSAQEFFKKYEKRIEAGNLESSDSSGNIKITKRINSKSGSEVFAVTVYEQI